MERRPRTSKHHELREGTKPMRNMRTIHLYLGCLFAPLLIFFTITGAWQTFGLHEGRRDGGYSPPDLVKSLSSIHKDQRYAIAEGMHGHSVPFRWFVLAMSLGLLISTVLGILMAFKYTQKRRLVWIFLIVGTVLPFVLLSFGGGR